MTTTIRPSGSKPGSRSTLEKERFHAIPCLASRGRLFLFSLFFSLPPSPSLFLYMYHSGYRLDTTLKPVVILRICVCKSVFSRKFTISPDTLYEKHRWLKFLPRERQFLEPSKISRPVSRKRFPFAFDSNPRESRPRKRQSALDVIARASSITVENNNTYITEIYVVRFRIVHPRMRRCSQNKITPKKQFPPVITNVLASVFHSFCPAAT